MVAHAREPFITPEEYLKLEHNAETKSEYYDGVIVAMSGASPEHDRVAVNLLRHFGNQLEGTACEPFSSDMRVFVPACNTYFYPDVSVACGGSQFQSVDGVRSLTNPRLIVEVLSDSTETRDRNRKFRCYQTLESVQTYVLIAQDRLQVEVFSRLPGNRWEYVLNEDMEAALDLPSIGCRLRLAEIYARVEFPPAPTEAEAE